MAQVHFSLCVINCAALPASNAVPYEISGTFFLSFEPSLLLSTVQTLPSRNYCRAGQEDRYGREIHDGEGNIYSTGGSEIECLLEIDHEKSIIQVVHFRDLVSKSHFILVHNTPYGYS